MRPDPTTTDDPKPREALAAQRRGYRGQVIAVAGGLGKSTARRMIETVLLGKALLGKALLGQARPEAAQSHAEHGDEPLGTMGECLLGMLDRPDYAVVEWKAADATEHSQLLESCAPTGCVVTRLSGHDDIEGRLLAALPADGWAVLDGDDQRLRKLAVNCPARIMWVGRSADCDLSATVTRCGEGSLEFSVDGWRASVPVWGRHHLHAALAAVAVGQIAGIERREIAARLGRFDSLPGRCEVLTRDDLTIINDMDGRTPWARRAALELLRAFPAAGRRAVLCLDANEHRDATPEDVAAWGEQVVTVAGADALWAAGDLAGPLIGAAREAGLPAAASLKCPDIDQLLPCLEGHIQPGDVVLVQGTPSRAAEQVLRRLREWDCHAAA
jgi:UDP-N-acetylmuramyl pentapeptide synthase